MKEIDRVCPPLGDAAKVPDGFIRIKVIMSVEDAKVLADDRVAAFVFGEMRAYIEGLGSMARDAEEGMELAYCDVLVDRVILPVRVRGG